ncbi:MAG: FIST signal transduction protein [Nannocystales bacterium]
MPEPSLSRKVSASTDPAAVARDLVADLPSSVAGGVIFVDAELDVDRVRAELAQRVSQPFVGVTSCRGVGSDLGLSRAVGLWFCDGVDVLECALASTPAALVGELESRLDGPDVNACFAFCTPGQDPTLLSALKGSFGEATMITGGGAADTDVSGRWRVFDRSRAVGEGCVALAALWPGRILPTFNSGYLPSSKTAAATQVEGQVLVQLDGRPAAEVYDEWTGGLLGEALREGGVVLDKTTLRPLGVTRVRVGSVPAYTLLHPERVRRHDGALALFAEVNEGETVTMMHTTRRSLLRRGAQILDHALDRGGLRPEDLAAAVIVNCGGCRIAIGDEAETMLKATSEKLPNVPYAMPFTFGEFGNILPGKTSHGNLMLSALLFEHPR